MHSAPALPRRLQLPARDDLADRAGGHARNRRDLRGVEQRLEFGGEGHSGRHGQVAQRVTTAPCCQGASVHVRAPG